MIVNDKLTNNEIIKALECCVSMDGNCEQNHCPIIKECGKDLMAVERHALSLIKRQKAEIERLNEYISRCKSGEEYWVKCLLERPNEAIKEFAERLKSTNLYEFIEEYYENAELCYEVRQDQFEEYCDNLVKEMVGDDNG